MGRNFGNRARFRKPSHFGFEWGLQSWDQVEEEACFLKLHKRSSYKDGDYWYNGGDSASRKKYWGFLTDLQAEFIADGRTETRKRSSTGIVSGYISRGYNPNQGLACAYATAPDAKWYPPTYEDYLTVWNYYAGQAAAAGTYPDMRLVVQHFYEGQGPIAATPPPPPPPGQETGNDLMPMKQLPGSYYRSVGLKESVSQGVGTQSGGMKQLPDSYYTAFKPASFKPVNQTAISQNEIPSLPAWWEMGLGAKVAIGLGVLGIGAFVARRQGWI